VLTLLLLTSCSIPEEQGTIEVHFCPNCEEILTKTLNQSNVKCAFYDYDLNLLKQDAKLIMDNDNCIDKAKCDKSSKLMHNKFCIINNIVLTGSTNPTYNGVNKNNNNLIIINSTYLAKNYNDEFNEMWDNTFHKGKETKYQKIIFNNFLIENYFCPDDNCEEKVINTLNQAKESIYFMTFSFTSDKIGDLLIELNNEIQIKGIFDNTQQSKWSEEKKMQHMNIKFDNNKPGKMHHKVFIIDNKTVITGSYNPTKNGNENNDENILIIHNENITKEFVEEFKRLWDQPT